MSPCRIVVDLTRALLMDKAELAAENLALRQQLAAKGQKARTNPKSPKKTGFSRLSGTCSQPTLRPPGSPIVLKTLVSPSPIRY
jgi:hypothetical protein